MLRAPVSEQSGAAGSCSFHFHESSENPLARKARLFVRQRRYKAEPINSIRKILQDIMVVGRTEWPKVCGARQEQVAPPLRRRDDQTLSSCGRNGNHAKQQRWKRLSSCGWPAWVRRRRSILVPPEANPVGDHPGCSRVPGRSDKRERRSHRESALFLLCVVF